MHFGSDPVSVGAALTSSIMTTARLQVMKGERGTAYTNRIKNKECELQHHNLCLCYKIRSISSPECLIFECNVMMFEFGIRKRVKRGTWINTNL